jgi:phosphoribosylformimino-5-aminoimidazole carboxamide ribonucleotide (ProFAR) isomerase
LKDGKVERLESGKIEDRTNEKKKEVTVLSDWSV